MLGDTRLRRDFKLNATLQTEQKILNHSAFFIPATRRGEQHVGGSSFMTKIKRRLNRWFGLDEKPAQPSLDFALRVRLEHAPYASSRIKLSTEKDAFGQPKGHLHMALGPLETKTIDAVQRATAAAIGASGLGRMQIDETTLTNNFPKNAGWQYHHLGGTRMANSPKNGVVDHNCKIFGLANGYIAGGSVFPTSGHANPTFNLVALTLRLSDHLSTHSL